MALVPGEDSESDEEINTEHLQSLVLTPDGSLTGYRGMIMKGVPSQQKAAGVVMGEESETDDEEEGSVEQTDGGGEAADGGGPSQTNQSSAASSVQDVTKEEPVETTAPDPQSLLHKKLRERNQSLRKNVVDKILKLYRTTCRNLTLVNNNLSKAQGTVETVNSNLKRGEHDLSELNSIMTDINTEARSIAPTLSIKLSHTPKKSPSPIRQRLFKGVPKVYNLLGAGSSAAATSPVPQLPLENSGEDQSLATKVPEARLEGQSLGVRDVEALQDGQGLGLKIPEAQPGQVGDPKA